MSSTSFQDRFKGKTVLMTKEGVDGVIKDSDNPIPKAGGAQPYRMDDFTSHLRCKHKIIKLYLCFYLLNCCSNSSLSFNIYSSLDF